MALFHLAFKLSNVSEIRVQKLYYSIIVNDNSVAGFSGVVEADYTIAEITDWGPGYGISFEFYLHSNAPGDSYGYTWLFGVRGMPEQWQGLPGIINEGFP